MAGDNSHRRAPLHRLSSVLFRIAVAVIVLLAVYVSAGRLLSNSLSAYQQPVLAELNRRLPFAVATDSLGGDWHNFNPELVFRGLRLSLPDSDIEPQQLRGGRVGIDVFDSIASRSLQLTTIELEQLSLRGELTEDGRLVLPGLTGGGGQLGAWLRDFVLNLELLTLTDSTLLLRLPSGEERSLQMELTLSRRGSERQLAVSLATTRGLRLQLRGRGVGNPFIADSFTGNVYVEAGASDLGATADLMQGVLGVGLQGELSSSWWLRWNRGTLDVDLKLVVTDAVVSPREGGWALPLDELSLAASLEEQRNHWTVYASDVRLRRDDHDLLLSRLQLDAWGESLRVRARALDLAQAAQLVLGQAALPEEAQAVLATLNPRGRLAAVQLAVADLADPAGSWDLEANFDELEVDSWRGAPGVTAASGYLDLSAGGGYVVLDSQGFSMAFPTVYREPLRYDDFYGTLHLDWDEQALVLHSDLITAAAEEGTARALFRLNIPFRRTEPGLEMDLMVGLADSHPLYRNKYLPYTLPGPLRDWLDGAFSDGVIEEAAFIWRGSLRSGAEALRTVQLGVSLSEADMAYQPGWPPVTGLAGTALVDDTRVSVWAERAQLYNSSLAGLSAESAPGAGGAMLLAIAADMAGPAADGLRVINESPLGEWVGGAFGDWRLSGDLHTRLSLLLDLANAGAPQAVVVEARLQQADLVLPVGQLQVAGINGLIRYGGDEGFSSEGLSGSLWGQPVTGSLRQLAMPDTNQPGFELDVELEGRLGAQALRSWLDSSVLDFAQGDASVSAVLEIRGGQAPVLQARSQLAGVALDLPAPYGKDAEALQPLRLRWPLASDPEPLALWLGDDVALELLLDGSALAGATLALGGHQGASPVAGSFVIAGSVPRLDISELEAFSDRYLAGAEDTAGEGEALRLQVNDLMVSQLAMAGRSVADLRLSLAVDPGAWQMRFETDWLRGSYFQPVDGRGGLKLDYLELDGLIAPAIEEHADATQPPVAPTPETEPLQVPPMQVVVTDLRRHGATLGRLQFGLESSGPQLRASDIQGELAGLQLGSGFPASLEWQQGVSTSVAARLDFEDFGSTLEQLGYVRILETEAGILEMAVSWPGAPQDFALAAATGRLALEATEGRFLETPSGATGALRVVSILNLADVVQRLSVSQMFESGIPFDSLGAEVLLQAGLVQVPAMIVQGSSSGFVLSGESLVSERSLDGELVATLPVAGNLPWMAALAGGLPVAAGVFVVSKVFEKQVNRLSSGVYTIAGTWDEPTVTFDRIFDDELRAGQGESVAPDSPSPGPASPGVQAPAPVEAAPQIPALESGP